MGLRDLVNPIPAKEDKLADFITKNYSNVRNALVRNPKYKDTLDKHIKESYAKYSKYLDSKAAKATGYLAGGGRAVGYASDTLALPIGLGPNIPLAMGGKVYQAIGTAPEKLYGLVYGVRTGNYMDTVKNIAQGLVGLLPGATVVDEGLTRIIKKRMAKEARTKFEKEVGIYEPWHKKIANKIKGKYKDVKSRDKNVFKPSYGGPTPRLA